jgi:DnaJ-class molecular chaperone
MLGKKCTQCKGRKTVSQVIIISSRLSYTRVQCPRCEGSGKEPKK